jgi:hypothetical protein
LGSVQTEKWANLGGKLKKMTEMAQEWRRNLVNQEDPV